MDLGWCVDRRHRKILGQSKPLRADSCRAVFCQGWPDSVPEAYRGWIFGPVYGKAPDAPEGYKKMLHILAVDRDGKALTLQGACDNYLGADGYNVVVTTALNAMAMADEYCSVVNA